MTMHDVPYLELVKDVLENGVEKEDRTGTGTLSVFGRQMRFDLSDGTIPLLTTKKMHTRSVIHEILWYLSGDTNIKYLNDNNVTIWDEWADETGYLGPVYGYQWRRWPDWVSDTEIDQIAEIIHLLKTDPNSRRMIVNSWNVAQIDDMALPPCHYAFQFYVSDGRLSCLLNQRSCDVGLGVPFNIVQYSILTRMIAEVVGLMPGEFVWSGGDVHIYKNHIESLQEQLKRAPHPSPKLTFSPKSTKSNIDNFRFEDFVISGYKCHPTLKMEVSV